MFWCIGSGFMVAVTSTRTFSFPTTSSVSEGGIFIWELNCEAPGYSALNEKTIQYFGLS